MKTLLIILLCCIGSGMEYNAFAQVSGCTDPQSNNYNPAATINDGSCTYNATNLTLTNKTTLSAPLLNETSGLTFLDGKLWTFNDSGNANDIYRIDTSSSTVFQTVDISNATNVDWEDMASNTNHLFIGDFGNNNGDRQNLRIYRVNKSDLTTGATSVTAAIINFSYSDQTSFQTLPTNHNFDCEAMIFLNDSIHLFSKNWVDLQTKHYVLPNTPGTHVAQYRETLNTGFLVTGATVQSFGVISLIGYLKTGAMPVSMYMIYDYKNNLLFNGNKRKFDVSTQFVYGQVEGVEFFNSSVAFVTNELFTNGATTVTARLRTFNVSSYLPASFLIPEPIADFSANNVTVCTNAVVSFNNQSINSPVSYQWSFPGGTPATSTAVNPQVQYSTPGMYPVTLIATNSAGSDTIVKDEYITVAGTIPIKPAAINGSTTQCAGSNGIILTCSTVSNATSYNWVVPSTVNIVSGQGTSSITVNFLPSFISGSFKVAAVNCVGSSAFRNKTIFGKPAKPGVISGQSEGICAGSANVSYSISPVNAATNYTWKPPANATITNGQGTTSVSISFNSSFTSGTMQVSASNSCGASAVRTLFIRSIPTKPGIISGNTTVCANQQGVIYSITPVVGAINYNWVVPPGATITSGQNSASVTVNFGTGGGNVKVRAGNACGNSTYRILAVAVTCREAGVANTDNFDVTILPNPTLSNFVLRINSMSGEKIIIKISDITGRKLSHLEVFGEEQINEFGSELPAGIYFAEIIGGNTKKVLKLVKQ